MSVEVGSTSGRAPGGVAELQKPRPTRVIKPDATSPYRFPRWAAVALAVALAVNIPLPPNATGGVRVVTYLASILGGIGLAAWLEERLYAALQRRNAVLRIVLSLLMPPIALAGGVVVSLGAGLLSALIRDEVTLGIAAFVGTLWFASAAAGSMVIVGIDVVISTLVKSFRARVQLAVLALLSLSSAAAAGLYAVYHLIIAKLPTIDVDKLSQNLQLDFGAGVLRGAEAKEALHRPETAEALAWLFVLLAVLLALPAVLSACGKLADAVMERLYPLGFAFDEIGKGELDVEVEEAGSRDFVRISQGFNRMARSLAATVHDLDQRNRELSETNAATVRFVPLQFLQLLEKSSIKDIALGDQVDMDVSVLFCDIRGFTTLAETMGAEATFAFINRYLSFMEPAIHQHGGFINDIMGDGIMALFHQSADHALRGALAMTEALARFNRELEQEGRSRIAVGIGLHTGPLMLGTIGGKDRLSCTVIGDPANTASRIEGMTKLYGAALLVSGSTRARLRDPGGYRLRLVDRVRAKGKTEPVEIYEVLDAAGDGAAKGQTLVSFGQALDAYRKGHVDTAAGLFARCRVEVPTDAAAALYVERCSSLREEGLPSGWDGVWRLESK